jgi:hypothetical protein
MSSFNSKLKNAIYTSRVHLSSNFTNILFFKFTIEFVELTKPQRMIVELFNFKLKIEILFLLLVSIFRRTPFILKKKKSTTECVCPTDGEFKKELDKK